MKQFYLSIASLMISSLLSAQNWSGTTPGNIYYNQGKVGIGTPSPTSLLDVNGDIAIKYGNALKVNAANDGNWTDTSNRIILRTSWNSEVHDYVDFKVPGAIPNTANMRFTKNGRLGIGTTTPDAKLAVNGRIHAKEVKVDLNGWSDFVFENTYELITLEEVENYIVEHKHLPEIPSEAEVMENGINLGEIDAKLLQKIEELTLYLIEQNKQLKKAHRNIAELQKEVSTEGVN